MTSRTKIFYAAGPGDVVDSYRNWCAGASVDTETQLTLSGQFFDFCRDHGLQAYAVSSHSSCGLLRDGPFIVENRPKLISRPYGLSYHLIQILSGLSLIGSALRFGVHVVVVDSGATHWFMLSLLKLARVRVVASIHNTFWPNGFLPTSGLRRTVVALDGWFWRNCADATLCVSPECRARWRQFPRVVTGPSFNSELNTFENCSRRCLLLHNTKPALSGYSSWGA